MSDHILQTGTAENHGQEQEIAKKAPLFFAAMVVALSVLLIVVGQNTSIGVIESKEQAVKPIGAVSLRMDNGATIFVQQGADGKTVEIDPSLTAFTAGPLRSLTRMNGAPLPDGTELIVLRIRGGMVFLENKKTGDRISLNAFSHAKAAAFADLIEQNGGAHNGTD